MVGAIVQDACIGHDRIRIKDLTRGAKAVICFRMLITNDDIIKRNFFLGFIWLHILFHAYKDPIFGLE